MDQTRFRAGVLLAAAGGIVFVIATIASGSDAVFAVGVALVGLGLLVHLTDPIARRIPLMGAGLALAVAGAALDAVATAMHAHGALNTVGVVLLIGGAGGAVAASRSSSDP